MAVTAILIPRFVALDALVRDVENCAERIAVYVNWPVVDEQGN